MSFCCGASMLGTQGTLKHMRTHIHNVPIVFCPVCHKVDVHYLIESEYELLAEYAHSDGAMEVDFQEYMDHKPAEALFENCVNNDQEDPMVIVRNQIDMALDLLTMAKALKDREWEEQLKKRLGVLVQRRNKLKAKKLLEQ